MVGLFAIWSLYDRESKVKNSALQVTDDIYRELAAYYGALGIPCTDACRSLPKAVLIDQLP